MGKGAQVGGERQERWRKARSGRVVRVKTEKEKGDEAWVGGKKGWKCHGRGKERGMKGKTGRTDEKSGRGESRKEETGNLGMSERRWTQGAT